MSPSSNIRVKICCISSVKEAQLAIKYGASALGLVSEMPSGPGVIDEELITEIVKTVPPPIATFLLTSKTSAEEIFIQQRKTKVNTLQLVDFVEVEELKKLRHRITPEVKLVQVIHVLDEKSSSRRHVAVEPFVDALLAGFRKPQSRR
jgi:phosphoribosylanthranilate isomerase